MKFIALIGLLALTACGTYVARLYDYHGAAERGEAPAEAPAESDKGDKGDDGEGKGFGKGEADTGKSHGGKDKGDEGDDD